MRRRKNKKKGSRWDPISCPSLSLSSSLAYLSQRPTSSWQIAASAAAVVAPALGCCKFKKKWINSYERGITEEEEFHFNKKVDGGDDDGQFGAARHKLVISHGFVGLLRRKKKMFNWKKISRSICDDIRRTVHDAQRWMDTFCSLCRSTWLD